MSGSGALPNHDEPEGSLGYGALEDFAAATGTDWILLLVNEITAAATGYTNLQDALEKIASQIGFPEFAQLLLSAFEGIVGSFFNFVPWFINLTDFLGFDLNIDPNDFNPLSLGIAFIKHLLGLLNPSNLIGVPIFQDLLEAILGQAGSIDDLASFIQLPFGAVQDVIDQIWDAFNSGIFGSSFNNPLSNVFQAVFGIFGTGSNAQAVNLIQDTRLDALAGGTAGLFDAFDGSASSALNSTNWTQTYFGSGSGTCGLSGDGFCVWNTSGSSLRSCLNAYKTVTDTDTQSVSVGLGANIPSNSGAASAISLFGRCNVTGSDYVLAAVTDSEVEIGYVVGNVYTALGATQSLTTDTSGTWQLKLGTDTDDREFVLLRNGATVISRTDSADASALDSSHRYTGFGMQAGWNFSIFWGFPVQAAPPPVGAWAASDRDPST